MFECFTLVAIIIMYVFDWMSRISVPCHEGPPATTGHFRSEPEVAAGGRYYCRWKILMFIVDVHRVTLPICGLTTLETRRLRGDQIEVFKILNGYENIDSNIFFLN